MDHRTAVRLARDTIPWHVDEFVDKHYHPDPVKGKIGMDVKEQVREKYGQAAFPSHPK